MIRFSFFTFTALPALAADTVPNIVGSWRSDAKATSAYLEKHAKLNERQEKVFPNLFGRCVVTFRADGTGSLSMEATTIPKKDGGQIKIEANGSEFRYKILDSARSQVVIRSDMSDRFFEGHPFAILTFHDPDTYSVSLSDSIAEINGREYFVRVDSGKREDNKEQAGIRPGSKVDGGNHPRTESKKLPK